eukprot:4518799-Prymnesium_polylepis.1
MYVITYGFTRITVAKYGQLPSRKALTGPLSASVREWSRVPTSCSALPKYGLGASSLSEPFRSIP